MNYRRVYDEFIGDRLTKQPVDGQYYEVHHIKPRCMGGDDTPRNLIRLSHSDHIFAHVLLARAYRGIEFSYHLNGAVLVLARESLRGKRTGRSGKQIGSLAFTGIKGRRLRRLAEEAKSARLVAQHGDKHPSADRTVYRFKNKDGREFVGTRSAFCAEHNVSAGSLPRLLLDEANQTKDGWSIYDEGKSQAERIRQADPCKYVFTNVVSGATYKGTRRGFHLKTNTPWEVVHLIVDSHGASPGGWLIH